MAVIIYGMDMPDACQSCPFCYDRFCRISNRWLDSECSIPEWCSLRYEYMSRYATAKEKAERKQVVLDRVLKRQQKVYFERKAAGCCVQCGMKDFRTEYLHKITCEKCAKKNKIMTQAREARKKQNVHK